MPGQSTADRKQTTVTGTSLRSFDEAAQSAFSRVIGDPRREGAKAAEVSRLWVTAGGVVGHTQYHAELRVLDPDHVESAPSVENAGGPDAVPPPDWTCENWSATHDRMPGSPATLTVTGTCSASTGDHHYTLIRHEPQGFNHRDLLLQLVVEGPDEGTPEATTEKEVRYTEDTDVEYDTVSILPHGPFGLEVQVVH